MAAMLSSGSITSPVPLRMKVFVGSATSSSASKWRSMRSVRQSFAISTTERGRLPLNCSSLVSKRVNSANASAVAPAKPARILPLYRRRSFFAEPFNTSEPSVTCPSPAITTLPSRRTHRIVVDRIRSLMIVNFSVTQAPAARATGSGAVMPATLAGALVRFALHGNAVLISRVLPIQLRGAQLREAVRRESAQEVHQIVNLARRKPQRLHLGVEERVSLPALIEEFDDVPQSFQASIVHVRPGQKHVPQKWRSKAADIFPFLGNQKTAQIRVICFQRQLVDFGLAPCGGALCGPLGQLIEILLARGDSSVVKAIVAKQRQRRIVRMAASAARLAREQSPSATLRGVQGLLIAVQKTVERRLAGK